MKTKKKKTGMKIFKVKNIGLIKIKLKLMMKIKYRKYWVGEGIQSGSRE